MKKEKRSLFEWLTGGSGADDDYAFDDLETGSSAYGSAKVPTSSSRATSVLERHEYVEEPQPEGELAVDVFQTPTHIIIKAMIAGVKPEDFEVSITRDLVVLRGKRERHSESAGSDFFFQELYWGAFSRSIVLPQEVEIEDAEAVEKHGLLTIKLPKLDKGRQAKLRVKSS